MTTKVTVGPRAYSFHDQNTGITICKGEVKELSTRQLQSKRIRQAMSSGHLIMVMEAKEAQKYTKEDINKLLARLRKQAEKGMDPSKAAKSYSMEEATLMAKELGIEIENGDTVHTVVEAMFTEVNGEE